MRRAYLFIESCLLAGIGGAGGSILGNGFGGKGLWIGGVIGGLLGAVASAYIARALRLIAPAQLRGTAAGAAAGFLAAALIAVNTLSSPIGPVLATALVGIGAIIGSRLGGADVTQEPEP
jgi:hypothetical protein